MSYVKCLFRFMIDMAKELSDESAYRRYLNSRSLPASGEAWRRFSDHRLKRKYRNGKCC